MIHEVKEILLQWRSPETPIVLARNLGRAGQTVQVLPLDQLTPEHADMRTVLLVGSWVLRVLGYQLTSSVSSFFSQTSPNNKWAAS